MEAKQHASEQHITEEIKKEPIQYCKVISLQ